VVADTAEEAAAEEEEAVAVEDAEDKRKEP
jgi:hypothetical protein